MFRVLIHKNLLSFHPIWRTGNLTQTQMDRPAPWIVGEEWHIRLGDIIHTWLTNHCYPDYIWGTIEVRNRSQNKDSPMDRFSIASIWVGFTDRKLAMKFKLEWGNV